MTKFSSFSHFSDTMKPIIEQDLSSFFKETYADSRDTLTEAIRYSLLSKSKRIRPLLVIAVYRLFSHQLEPILPLCSSIEMLHTYSLIHDDLPAMDNDDLRRGQYTCHKKYGEYTAILAGDTLNTMAFEVIGSALPLHFSPPAVLSAIVHLAKACGTEGMAGGQMMDLMHTGTKYTLEESVIQHIHLLKTGALLRACVVLPAILQCISGDLYDNLDLFGYHIGLLFQISDDILDVVASSETLGKTAQKDQAQHKQTYVRTLGLDGAKKAAAKEYKTIQKILANLQVLGQDVSELNLISEYLFARDF